MKWHLYINEYLSRQSSIFLVVLNIAMVLLIGSVDYLLGYEMGLSLFYLMPITFAAWLGDKRAGLIISTFSLITIAATDYWAGKVYPSPLVEFWNLFVRLGFFVIISLLVSRLRAEFDEHRRLIDRLEGALREIKQLNGLLPICASCKKIRDDNGGWTQIETYISRHTDAEFTHGICPECAEKLYPDIFTKSATE